MLRSTNLLEDLELFEDLDDRVSEKFTGGLLVDLQGTLDEFKKLSQFGLLQPGLLTKIQEKIERIFPQVGTDLALGCVSTTLGVYDCTVSTADRTETFTVDMRT